MATQFIITIDTSSANDVTPVRYPDIFCKSDPEKKKSKDIIYRQEPVTDPREPYTIPIVYIIVLTCLLKCSNVF